MTASRDSCTHSNVLMRSHGLWRSFPGSISTPFRVTCTQVILTGIRGIF